MPFRQLEVILLFYSLITGNAIYYYLFLSITLVLNSRTNTAYPWFVEYIL